MKNLYSLSSYQFELPQELIAQRPCIPRDHARLMLLNRSTQTIDEMVFHDLVHFLNKEDQLIFNNTKVIPARLIGKRESGGETEIFLTRQLSSTEWEAMVRPGKKLKLGSVVRFGSDFFCTIGEQFEDGRRVVTLQYPGSIDEALQKFGKMPLPLYIKRESEEKDSENYQTVYAKNPGALAAPTAGLHFTREMLQTLQDNGVYQTHLTLHVGLGTFRTVQTEDIRQHPMHSERVIISSEAAQQLNRSLSSNRRICVGTTSCRALEAVASEQGVISEGEFDANIFIYPGYRFKYVNALLTNFHLPGSTLLMLVAAFAGYDFIWEAYQKAIKERYRFFSYGDAMLII